MLTNNRLNVTFDDLNQSVGTHTRWTVVSRAEQPSPGRRDRTRGDHAMATAALQALESCAHADLACEIGYDPKRLSDRLNICFELKQSARTKRQANALISRIESALRLSFSIVRAKPNQIGGRARRFKYAVGIESTLKESCLLPARSQWSAGRPLAVRDAVDWPMLLSAISKQSEPFEIRMRMSSIDHSQMLGELDKARRQWELESRMRRHESNAGEDRRHLSIESASRPRRVVEVPPLNSSVRWPTRGLEALATLANQRPVYLRISAASENQALAHAMAEILQSAFFDKGTAQTSEIDPACGDLLTLASEPNLYSFGRVACSVSDAAMLLLGPPRDISCPSLLRSFDEAASQPEKESFLLGMQYDEFADRVTDVPVRPLWKGLNQHAMLDGLSGTGKTSLFTQLQSEAARADPPISFLSLSFAKNESSAITGWKNSRDPRLRDCARRSRVYGLHPSAPLQARVSPFGLEGADPLERADHGYRVIRCGVSAEGPLAGLFLDGTNRLCQKPDALKHPSVLTDLVGAMTQSQEDAGYTDNVKADIGGAGQTRLNTLTKGINGEVFRATVSTPAVADLLKDPHVISLGHVDLNIAAMFLVDLFLRLYRYLILNPVCGKKNTNGRPRLILFLDEFQEISPRFVAHGPSDQPNPIIEVARLIRRMLKVFRAYDVPVFLGTQHVGAVDEESVKAPGTHFAFAQRHGTERREIAEVMNLSPEQCERLNDLPVGHGYYRSPPSTTPGLVGSDRPVRVVIPFDPEIHGLKPVDDATLATRCANSKADRHLTIKRCDDELTLREQRLTQALHRLLSDRRSLSRLRRAGVHADAAAAGDASHKALRQKIDAQCAVIRKASNRRHRAFAGDWTQTLRPLPPWLAAWAAAAKERAPHRIKFLGLQRRHDRLVRGYARLALRHNKLNE